MRAEIKLFVLHIDPDDMSAFPDALKSNAEEDVAQKTMYASAKVASGNIVSDNSMICGLSGDHD